MQIECPSCTTDNKIEFGENIVCSECKESLSGHSYKKFKKPLLSATTALFIGAFGTYKADQILFEDQRYPLNVEYELVDSCVNSSRIPRSSYHQADKIQICLCALEKTMQVISYKEAQKNESEFLTRFRGSLTSCN
ncbi:hypothetical protein BZG76_10240 [Salinivibrio sp. AR647]|nr:hypothetical protein BZG76_10240 [Salinivibrio sp. AR647]OOF00357.1 hypothetical protein BZG77_00425 [Salinivibrio sp. IB643]